MEELLWGGLQISLLRKPVILIAIPCHGRERKGAKFPKNFPALRHFHVGETPFLNRKGSRKGILS